jgi:hypothetical protein
MEPVDAVVGGDAQAVARGHIEVAEALLNLDDDWIAKINADPFD